MIEKALEFVAPHICCGCKKDSKVLCDNCKNNIVFDRSVICLRCMAPCSAEGLCGECKPKLSYKGGWFVNKRVDELEALIDTYKFNRVKSVYSVLADLLDESMPQFGASMVVVPIPTVPGHIRQRGYDHTLLIARAFAKKRHLRLERLIERATNSTQLGKSATDRERQAKSAFAVYGKPDPKATYLLLDDIVTTGSTVKYAAKALIDAGASDVYVAAVARQPSTKGRLEGRI